MYTILIQNVVYYFYFYYYYYYIFTGLNLRLYC